MFPIVSGGAALIFTAATLGTSVLPAVMAGAGGLGILGLGRCKKKFILKCPMPMSDSRDGLANDVSWATNVQSSQWTVLRRFEGPRRHQVSKIMLKYYL